MKTPRKSATPIKIGEGEYLHFGIQDCFTNLNCSKFFDLNSIDIDIGSGGMQFF